ncbi:MAG: metallophosphoesterase [Candidatus Bathyarchaeia archaeon]
MLTPVKNYPALLYKKKQHKYLIIADLHLGWEMNLTQKGIHVPSQMPKILQRLLQLINMLKPDTLIILGDVKHTVAKAELGEWRDVPEFFETLTKKIIDIQIIRGNHDGNIEPLLPPTTKLHPSTGITLNTVGLFHGHTWPARELLNCTTLIIGHVHPTIALRDPIGFQIVTPVWIKAKYDPEKLEKTYLKSKRTKMDSESITPSRKYLKKAKVKQLLIMPCFNDFLGGRPVNKQSRRKRYTGPVLRSDAINLDIAEIYLLDGAFLGTIRQLKALD